MKTIYNTYVKMESQEQCDRMKKLCIDNGLKIWNKDVAFKYITKEHLLIGNGSFLVYDDNDFFIANQIIFGTHKITEDEFIKLLQDEQENK